MEDSHLVVTAKLQKLHATLPIVQATELSQEGNIDRYFLDGVECLDLPLTSL